MTNPCQSQTHDAFCQSWSLFLVIEWWIKARPKTPIEISWKQDNKYEILLTFYKKLLEYPEFIIELGNSYKTIISDHEDYEELLKINPCELLKK